MRLHTLLCVLYKTFYIICVPFKLQRGKKDLIFTDVYTCAYIYIYTVLAPFPGRYKVLTLIYGMFPYIVVDIMSIGNRLVLSSMI